MFSIKPIPILTPPPVAAIASGAKQSRCSLDCFVGFAFSQ